MNVTLSNDDIAFRDEVRRYFRENYPKDILEKMNSGSPLSKDDMVRSMEALNARGWAGVNWPVEYGGTGWSPVQKYIF